MNRETDRTTRMVMDRVAALHPRFAIQVGDVAEIGGLPGAWRHALSVLSDLAAEVPVVAASGNHDYYSIGPSARNFKNVFPIANPPGSGARRDTWYSVTTGPIHVAVLDTEASGEMFDRQIEWLTDDLASARDAGVPWTFIVMHRPMVATTTSAPRMQWAKAVLPLVADYDVDAVFWGHDHLFEHYEYTYGANRLVFDTDDTPATEPVHMFTVPPAGARIDPLYPGFFTHRPYPETWPFVSLETGERDEQVFEHRPWNPDIALHELPGTRYQDPARYPTAASYYYWPFDGSDDEAAGRYSTDRSIVYNDGSPFFGYTYGETSIGYLWVEIDGDTCVISAHYVDGSPGEQGTAMRTPSGRQLQWVLR
jgi:hypothetical protein